MTSIFYIAGPILKVKASKCENCTLVLRNVACVPAMAINIISTSLMDTAGFNLVTQKGKTTVLFKGELVTVAQRNVDNLYVVPVAKPRPQILVSWQTCIAMCGGIL